MTTIQFFQFEIYSWLKFWIEHSLHVTRIEYYWGRNLMRRYPLISTGTIGRGGISFDLDPTIWRHPFDVENDGTIMPTSQTIRNSARPAQTPPKSAKPSKPSKTYCIFILAKCPQFPILEINFNRTHVPESGIEPNETCAFYRWTKIVLFI